MDTSARTRSARRRARRDDSRTVVGNGAEARGPRRRLHPAGQAVVVAVGALLLGALLNARGLHKTAQSMNTSWKRDLGLALTKPLQSVSDDTGLDLPRRGLQSLLSRSGDDDIVTAINLPPPPPPPPVHPHPRPPVVPPQTSGNLPPPPPPAPPRKKPAFSPQHPLKVYKPVDSVDGHVSTGLERPDVYNWFDRIRHVMKKDKPNVVVVAFGANDDHSYMTGLKPGQRLGDFGSTAWRKEYARRVGGFMDTVIRGGGFIVYIGMPIVSSSSESRDFDLLNSIIYQQAQRRPNGALYVDTYTRFADPKTGGYAQYLPRPDGTLLKVRSDDGVHFEAPGGDIIARLVLKALNERFDLTSWKHRPAGG